MITQDQINAARDVLRIKWDSSGDCGSCGWHADLSEYEVTDADIEFALEMEGG